MELVQTTMFGVRGERVKLGKRPALAKLTAGEKVDFHLRIGGEVTSTGHTVLEVWPRPNNFGCDVARISGVSGWVAQAALTRTPADAGAASGCGLLLLLAAALSCFALAWAVERRGVRVRIEWLKEYPAPVCERCGKVLDGTSAECAEEGKDQ